MISPFKNGLSLRLFFIIAGTLTAIIWIAILKQKKITQQQIEYFLILVLLNPLLGIGSIVATPDVPLVLFWSVSYYYFIQAMQRRTAISYGLLGVFLGLGFCSKYHIVLFVLCGTVYLIWSKEYRKLIPSKVLLTIFFGLLFCAPVILWNYHNEWISFTFQLKHGFGKTYYDWTWTAGFVVSQILILNPFLLSHLTKKDGPQEDRIFALSQFFFFFVSSFKAVVEANWPITSHLHGTSYVSRSISEKRFRWAIGYWAVIYVLFALVFILPQTQVLLKNQINSDQLDELIPIVQRYKPLYGPSYQISSLLTWMTGTEVYKLRGLSRKDLFDSLSQSQPTAKEFYVLKHTNSFWPDDFKYTNITLLQSFEKQQVDLFRVIRE